VSVGSSIVLIECPNCAEGVELDDASFGLFDCPFCEEEFEWSRETRQVYDAVSDPSGFAIGAIGPFATTCCGILYSMIVHDGLDTLVGILFSIILWPATSLVLVIYAYVRGRGLMLNGALGSLAVSGGIFLMFLFLGMLA
jgi:hypothetical protein